MLKSAKLKMVRKKDLQIFCLFQFDDFFVHVNLTIFFNFEFMEISHLSTGGRAPGDFCFPMPDVRIFTVIFFNSKILRMSFYNFWKYFRLIMIQRWSKPQYKAHKQ